MKLILKLVLAAALASSLAACHSEPVGDKFWEKLERDGPTG